MWQTALMKISMPYLLLLLNLVVFNAHAVNLIEGKVVSVADGDTVTVLDDQKTQHKIRLLGIDAPEKSQAFGEKSKQSLHGMVHGKVVQVTYDKRDKYGRIVGKVLLGSQDICHQQIKLGLAWHYKKYQNEQTPEDRDAYSESENTARSQNLGLWVDAQPLAPWDFRKK